MEVAICTRCQSSNPTFTKYCLTCGLVITAEMRHTITVTSPSTAKLAPTVSTIGIPTAVTSQSNAQAGNNQTENQAVEQPQPKKESEGWLKGFRFFSRS